MALMRFSASRMSPAAPYFFLIASSFFAAVAEQVFKGLVERVLFVQCAVGGFAFVEDLQRGPVVHRVHQAVGVDVLAEALVGFLLAVALGDQRRTGEGDARGVGECLEQVVAQV